MEFIQVDIILEPDYSEILIAELSEYNYDSFWEKEDGFITYVEKTLFDESILLEMQQKYPEAKIRFQYEGLESKNWNEEWEKNFQPIVVADKCYVRSTFHEPRPDYPLEIIIEPKMSFGTGHHATTSMMLEHLLNINLESKKLMDVGTGSGILAIAAAKLGATDIFAFDIDQWAVENTNENIFLNNTPDIKIKKGTIADFSLAIPYDIVLANITRNILLEELAIYNEWLAPNGILIISGFYQEDIPVLEATARSLHLIKTGELILEKWASLKFQK